VLSCDNLIHQERILTEYASHSSRNRKSIQSIEVVGSGDQATGKKAGRISKAEFPHTISFSDVKLFHIPYLNLNVAIYILEP
jgi:hypothetical protein